MDLLPECLYVHVNNEADQLDRTKVLLEEMTEETAVDFIRKIQNNILKQQFPSPIPAMEEARK
jgi:dihydroorotase